MLQCRHLCALSQVWTLSFSWAGVPGLRGACSSISGGVHGMPPEGRTPALPSVVPGCLPTLAALAPVTRASVLSGVRTVGVRRPSATFAGLGDHSQACTRLIQVGEILAPCLHPLRPSSFRFANFTRLRRTSFCSWNFTYLLHFNL